MKQKKNKDFGNKKHIITRIIVGSLLVVAAGAIGVASVFAFSAGIYINLAELALVIAGGSLVGGLAMSVKGIKDAISVKINKSVSIKSLNQIAEASKNKGLYTQEQRVKIAKKYAKANLKLCKAKGCPIVGKFKSQSDFEDSADVEAFNDRENYMLLGELSKSQHAKRKYQKKVQKIESKLSLPIENLKHDKYKVWTKSYDKFLDGATIYDRRTEIKCHQDSTLNRFMSLADIMAEPEKGDMGGFVKVDFNGSVDASNKPTFARVASVKYLKAAQQLMIDDIIGYCKEYPDKVSQIFPISIETNTYDKNASYYQQNVVFYSLDELTNTDNLTRNI